MVYGVVTRSRLRCKIIFAKEQYDYNNYDQNNYNNYQDPNQLAIEAPKVDMDDYEQYMA